MPHAGNNVLFKLFANYTSWCSCELGSLLILPFFLIKELGSKAGLYLSAVLFVRNLGLFVGFVARALSHFGRAACNHAAAVLVSDCCSWHFIFLNYKKRRNIQI